MQNVGAYGQEVSETIERVDAIERATGERVSLTRDACAFGYRDSVFKRGADGRYVVVRVCFRLEPSGRPSVRYAELERILAGAPLSLNGVRDAVLALRRSKSMVIDHSDENRRSAGSFFLNPVVDKAQAEAIAEGGMPRYPVDAERVKLSAAWLIEHAGMPKGTTRGRVGLSSRHSLAIVNRGGATAADIVGFAAEVRARVREHFGVTLVPEPRLLGFEPSEAAPLFA
jgi:UDP-N-acetylmuramate dehydrogenase